MLHTRAREKCRSTNVHYPFLYVHCGTTLNSWRRDLSQCRISDSEVEMLRQVRRRQRQNEVPVSLSCQHTEWSCDRGSGHVACGSDAFECVLAQDRMTSVNVLRRCGRMCSCLIGLKCSMKPLIPSVATQFPQLHVTCTRQRAAQNLGCAHSSPSFIVSTSCRGS